MSDTGLAPISDRPEPKTDTGTVSFPDVPIKAIKPIIEETEEEAAERAEREGRAKSLADHAYESLLMLEYARQGVLDQLDVVEASKVEHRAMDAVNSDRVEEELSEALRDRVDKTIMAPLNARDKGNRIKTSYATKRTQHRIHELMRAHRKSSPGYSKIKVFELDFALARTLMLDGGMSPNIVSDATMFKLLVEACKTNVQPTKANARYLWDHGVGAIDDDQGKRWTYEPAIDTTPKK